MQTIVFATSRADAQAYCDANGLVFEDVVWVMNYQLLGTLTDDQRKGADVHFTSDFKDMPAYGEAKQAFS